jgi:glyoxylase-like metal-dependent hydrolase (beta-lactamase superfamily II)
MNIHAIQTGTVAVKERQRHGEGPGSLRLLKTMADKRWTEPLPIYAWVVEHPEGIIVVDTGETSAVSQPGYFPWWHPYFKLAVREWVEPEEEIGPQLRSMGISSKDVRWLILTHLHTDHAGGLSHFPDTAVIVSRAEYDMALGVKGKLRGFLPHRWPSWFSPTLLDFQAKPFGPFPESITLTQAEDVVLVPTTGHTKGHMSLIVRDGDRMFFLAGDTSYTEELMLNRIADGVGPDLSQSLATVDRISRFIEETPTVYLPSHDPESEKRLKGRTASTALQSVL